MMRPSPRSLFAAALGRRLPLVDGHLDQPTLKEPVTIRRDRWGIPHISATNDHDAWYAVGFCQGQDRAFQIETRIRLGRGTLAEILGPDGVSLDQLSRRIGFKRSAEGQYRALAGPEREIVAAFAQGVTEGVRDGCPRPAHEFTLLRARPTPMEPTDVICQVGIMSFLLAANWDSELTRLKILLEDGPEAVAALDPVYPDHLSTTDRDTVALDRGVDRLAADLSTFLEFMGGIGSGSNNWVIGGDHTDSGRVIVANDPHLSPALPPHWYLCHVATPEWAAAGATLIGAVGFAAGHNGHVAWGATAGQIDNTDLFIEELSDDGHQARGADGWEPTEVHYENIVVRGKPSQSIKLIDTARGPVVSPALEGDFPGLSMRATWLNARPTRGVLTVHRATSAAEFPEHFEAWPGLSLNFVFGDDEGSIGWKLVGDAPRRRKGFGTIPLPAWDPDVGWHDDPVPAADNPGLLDPPGGLIATANNKAHQDSDAPHMTHDWLDGYRVDRIYELLSARDDWDVDAVGQMHLDRVTNVYRDLRALLESADDSDLDAGVALDLLAGWDGDLAPDSAAATVFELTVAELCHRMVRAKAPNAASWGTGRSAVELLAAGSVGSRRIQHMVDVAARRPDGWFPHGWSREMSSVLGSVVRRLRTDHGDDPAGWGWGVVRPLTLEHPVGMAAAPLSKIFNLGPFPWGGSAHTICNGAVDLNHPLTNPYGIASLRMVVELGDWDNASFVLPGGNSGNPASPHYDDMVEPFLAGSGVPMAWSERAVDAATTATLRLSPGTRAAN